ncbi:hypothetical protein V1524DRAFT_441394, partial [Lipomyces starkeyi]
MTIHGDEAEIRSRTLPSLLFEQPIQKQLRAFNSTSIPRELVLFPEYDLYNYCIKIFLDNFSMGNYPHRFRDRIDRTWVEVMPQFVMSSVPSSTQFPSRAYSYLSLRSLLLRPGHCATGFKLVSPGFTALKGTCQHRHFRSRTLVPKRHYSYPAPDNSGAPEQDSILPSSQPLSTANTRPSPCGCWKVGLSGRSP